MTTGIASVVYAVFAAALPAAAPTRPLGTIRQQVRRAKAELDAHPTLDTYHQSPYQPTEIVERIHALADDHAWAELCSELAQLPDDELELFEDEIRKPEHGRRLPCSPALLARIEAYWKAAERRLTAAHPLGVPTALPSAPVLVDTSQDLVFHDGKLAPGQI